MAVVAAMWGMSRCYGYELDLPHYYRITRYIKRNGDWYYYFWSNPRYTNVPQIDDVKSVALNRRLIVIEQMSGGTEDTAESTTPDAPNLWWIVPAWGEELRAGDDDVLGPMSEAEKEAWLETNPPDGRLKRRRH